MKTYYLLILSLFIGCASASQFTYYTPTENEQSWRVTVEQTVLKTGFECKINDVKVMSESFGVFGTQFEKEDWFQGKKVIMSGFRKSNITPTGEDSYTIRVFIDQKEVAKFDF